MSGTDGFKAQSADGVDDLERLTERLNASIDELAVRGRVSAEDLKRSIDALRARKLLEAKTRDTKATSIGR